jgi:hypothetical protein
MSQTKPRETYLSSDFAAEIEYKPKLVALAAENKALKELLREIVNYPSLKEFAEFEDKPKLGYKPLLAWWIAKELIGMNELIYEAYKAWSAGEKMDDLMNDIYDALVEMDFFDDEDEVEEST